MRAPIARHFVSGSLFALLCLQSACSQHPSEDPWQGQPRSDQSSVLAPDLVLRPESERYLDEFIMGLEPFNDGFYRLPLLAKNPGLDPAAFHEMQVRLYELNFELGHGAVLRMLPPNAELFVAAPEGKTAGPKGIEKEAFLQYLRQRCGWEDDDISQRVHFFPSQYPLVWLQDAGEILGDDRLGRAVIRIDSFGNPQYHENIRSLVRSYPKRFQLLETNNGVSAEGGDEEMVWLPDGRMGMMAGRNRALEYVRKMHDPNFDEHGMTRELADEARQAFAASFYNLPVLFVPWTVLLHPELGTPEIFHMDMMVTVMESDRDHLAFVPILNKNPIDANSYKPLDPALAAGCQSQYEEVAQQMKALGYNVWRLPFTDHPVRSPANVVKYVDRFTHHHTVMLARYPWHLPAGDPNSPARQLDKSLQDVTNAFGFLQEKPDKESALALTLQISRAWLALDSSVRLPNPDFDAQAAAFREAGVDVVTVPIYAGGSGGLHCMALR